MSKASKNLIITVICALLTFVIDFFFVPKVMRGIPDFIWMGMMVLLPTLLAILLFVRDKEYKQWNLFVGMVIQYVLLIAFASPISQTFGSSIEHALGWFGYIGAAFPWPLVVTIIQFVVLKIIHGVSNKEK